MNIGSIVFGLIAWILPVIIFVNGDKNPMLSVISFISYSISLCMVIFYIKHLVKREAWAALMDTVPSFSFVSAVLLMVTVVLNMIVLIIHTKKPLK